MRSKKTSHKKHTHTHSEQKKTSKSYLHFIGNRKGGVICLFSLLSHFGKDEVRHNNVNTSFALSHTHTCQFFSVYFDSGLASLCNYIHIHVNIWPTNKNRNQEKICHHKQQHSNHQKKSQHICVLWLNIFVEVADLQASHQI